jgi:hypothetical protein
MLSAREVAQALGGDVRGHDQVVAPGPGHSQADRSLSLKITTNGYVVNSFSPRNTWKECRDYVDEKLGLPKWQSKRASGDGKEQPSGEWIYRTEDGRPYLRVQRYDRPDGSKKYPQAHWNGKQWIKGKPKGPKIPYRLPELLKADLAEPVFIVEGEKCADALVRCGLVATTASEGAGKWTADLNKWFVGRIAYTLPDNDETGERHVELVASNLHGIAADLRIVPLPGQLAGQDIHNWLERGNTREMLLQLCEQAPKWTPPMAPPDSQPPIIALADWLKRDLPNPDLLLGSWLHTTSRTLLFAPTGLGKTMLLLALAMAAADERARGFLNWKGHRSARVLFIDGEMSRQLMKERLAAEVKRLGAIPAKLHILSHEDIEGWAPLNTPQGQAIIEREIERIGGADLIVFDNIMTLTLGDQKDEEVWSQMLPWVKSLTKRRIGQIWAHHTGHDGSRSYGTKTREWQMNNVICLEPIERPDTDVSIRLKFTKARERAPKNRTEFEDTSIAIIGDQWTWDTASKKRCKQDPSPLGQKFLSALDNVLAGDAGHTWDGKRCVMMDAWKKECTTGGLIDAKEKDSGRSLFSKYRRELVACDLVACEGVRAWRVK